MRVYSRFIIIAPNWERAQVSINCWMHEQIVVYSYNAILLSNKKEWTADIYTNMDEFKSIMRSERNRTQKVTQSLIPLVWQFLKGKTIMIEDQLFPGVRGWLEGDSQQTNSGELFGVMEIFYIMIVVVVTRLYTFVKTYWSLHWKLLDACKLYPKKICSKEARCTIRYTVIS